MRWRMLFSIGRWQLLAGRCALCGWPKLAIVRDRVMREWPNASGEGRQTAQKEVRHVE
jgi:hypothetical protein